MGRWHAHTLSRIGVRVVGVVDTDGARARALARRCARPPVFADLAEVPAGLQADAVHVCTPSHTHEALIELALERGWHVLVEKPFADSAEAAERLLALAGSRQLLACPVHQFIFQRGFRRVQAALSALGALRHVDAVVCSAGAEGRDDDTRRRIAIEIVPHALSMFARLIPSPLSQIEWRVESPQPGEIRAAAVAGRATLSILISLSGRPTRNTLRVIAERGTAHVDLFHGFAVLEPGEVSRARKVTRPFARSAATLAAATSNLAGRALRRQPAYPGLWELVARFHQGVRRGSAGPIEPGEILDGARAWDAIHAGIGTPQKD